MRAESHWAWPRLIAAVAAFSLVFSQTWADGSRAKTAPSPPTKQAEAVENTGKSTGISNSPQIMIEQVRVSQTNQRTQVRVEGNGHLSYVPLRLNQPDRLVLDFSGAFVHMRQKSIPGDLQRVRAVRVGQFKADVARVVIDLDGAIPYTVNAEGNAVTVVFEPSAVAGSRVAALDEKPITVNAAPADPPPPSSSDSREIDTQSVSSPEPLRAAAAVLASPAMARVKPSESVSAELRPAGVQPSLPPAPPPTPEQAGKDSGQLASVPSGDEYIIGPQDVVAINVWREPELSRAVPVRPDGKISLPLVGEVKANGLTPRMLQTRIAKELELYLNKPEVSVSVLEANSHKFNIVGEVLRPGSYPLAKPTTVLDAIATAGGFREFAKVKKIYVLRPVPMQPNDTVHFNDMRIHFNYRDVITGKHSAQNVELKPGDTVVVP